MLLTHLEWGTSHQPGNTFKTDLCRNLFQLWSRNVCLALLEIIKTVFINKASDSLAASDESLVHLFPSEIPDSRTYTKWSWFLWFLCLFHCSRVVPIFSWRTKSKTNITGSAFPKMVSHSFALHTALQWVNAFTIHCGQYQSYMQPSCLMVMLQQKRA